MTEISAKQVMELRKMTGAGMMECKKALGDTSGDVEAAVDLLRTKGLAKAAKKADRAANEGIISILRKDKNDGIMLMLNCETDFVSRNDDFKAMVDEIGQFLLNADLPEGVNGKLGDAEALEAVKGLSFKGSTLGEELTSAIARIGENMMIGALVAERSSDATDWLQEYKHGARVGVLVCLTTGNAATQDNPKFQELAKDIAMQIAAATPQVPQSVDRSGIDPEVLRRERDVLVAQAKEEGKPQEIAEKMVEGRIQKFYGEVCLLEQPFIKDDKQRVKDIVEAVAKELGDSISVARFHRVQMGE
ncbi:MAG: translation elongation factor Ts [Planctomycetales bacterium]|nr:translation elongation factor Ts [bacterium]UNM08320.1 MAG: translation elongation factor Ts [Planctomycetales bacterium]